MINIRNLTLMNKKSRHDQLNETMNNQSQMLCRDSGTQIDFILHSQFKFLHAHTSYTF